MALLNEEFSKFDESKIKEGSGEFLPVPDGWYITKVVKAELKDSSTGGQYINLRLDILGPSHQGRVLWHKLNIINKNPSTENNARRDLFLIGGGTVSDTDQLIGREIMSHAVVKFSEFHGKDENEIKSFKAFNESNLPSPTPAKPSGGGSPGGVKATPPWMKK